MARLAPARVFGNCWPFDNTKGGVDKVRKGDSPDAASCDSKLIFMQRSAVIQGL